MGVSPDIWGPSTWAFLHLMPFAEEEPLKQERLVYYKQLYELLTNLLPCQKCREHLQQNLSQLRDITKITTKKELFTWTAELHNKVNVQHGKKEYELEEVYQYWKNIAEGKTNLKGVPCTPVYWKQVSIVLMGIIIFYLLYSLFKNRLGKGRRKY